MAVPYPLVASAEKILTEFLKRVEEIREDDWYLYKVSKAYVFGSYLSDRNRINDVDVAIELVPKEKDRDTLEELNRYKAEFEMRGGRRLSFVEKMFWAKIEVVKFLKSRSRISVHEIEDLSLDPRAKLIYEDKN